MNIEEIIEKCGGVNIIAIETGLTKQAINLWAENGIPQKRWTKLLALSEIKGPGVTVTDLYNANQNDDNLDL